MTSSTLPTVKTTARLALGFIWIYQGLVPKVLSAVPLEYEIVARSGVFLISPAVTMPWLGMLEILLGLWLVCGYRERLACAVTTALLFGMTVAVVILEPALLIGPFGGIAKNVALFALAWIVWRLAAPEPSPCATS
ncbi:MAG: DoxX-like family protein [Verrucomicrobiota bacterium]